MLDLSNWDPPVANLVSVLPCSGPSPSVPTPSGLAWLPRYPLRDWLLGDLLAGLSVAIMQLPQGLAYALLAGLPPCSASTALLSCLVYFLFGTSRHISVGTFAVMSVMVGSVTESLAPDENFLQAVNSTIDEATRDATRVELASTLSVLVGLSR